MPDKKSSQIIAKISKDISDRCKSIKALRYMPHFTIRNHFKIEDENIVNLITDIKEYCENVKPLKLHLTNYGFYPWKIIFLSVCKNFILQNLHNTSMEIIEKYRIAWIPEKYLNNNNFIGKQKEYSLKYGYHFCFEFFSPHFTVAGNDMTEEAF